MSGKVIIFLYFLLYFFLLQDFAFSSVLFHNFPWVFELREVPGPIKLWANHKGLLSNTFISKLFFINVAY